MPNGYRMKVVRGLGGIVAGGTVALAVTVIGAAVMGARREFPGPGVAAVGWHVGAAIVVVAAQIYSDKRSGFAAFFGSLVVFVVAGYLLWAQWWN